MHTFPVIVNVSFVWIRWEAEWLTWLYCWQPSWNTCRLGYPNPHYKHKCSVLRCKPYEGNTTVSNIWGFTAHYRNTGRVYVQRYLCEDMQCKRSNIQMNGQHHGLKAMGKQIITTRTIMCLCVDHVKQKLWKIITWIESGASSFTLFKYTSM